jgi:Protein of unknown function (DUF1266)
MQLIKRTAFVFAMAIGLYACKSGDANKQETVGADKKEASAGDAAEITDETVYGFMLGGMYPAGGFGGVSIVMTQIDPQLTADVGSKEYVEQMQKAYKEVFAYPFDLSQKGEIIATLKDMWDITDKATLTKRLDELLDAKHSKAWDLARYANLINLAAGAGYITKAEGDEMVKKPVSIAKQHYNDWDTFMKEFNAGRKNWDPTDKDDAGYEKASMELLTTKNSIYKYLKL